MYMLMQMVHTNVLYICGVCTYIHGVCVVCYIQHTVQWDLQVRHFRAASFVLCKEVILFGRFGMYWDYREELFWDLKPCPL